MWIDRSPSAEKLCPRGCDYRGMIPWANQVAWWATGPTIRERPTSACPARRVWPGTTAASDTSWRRSRARPWPASIGRHRNRFRSSNTVTSSLFKWIFTGHQWNRGNSIVSPITALFYGLLILNIIQFEYGFYLLFEVERFLDELLMGILLFFCFMAILWVCFILC